ncbi:MAG: hypothetical protein JOY70_01110 [Acidisphaera sp.]|nr:hypothetical protein [Acidisphaera sp.]MBV9812314.1 hypothetical protein [Acetobacteraceae bacterium]
MTHVQAFSPAHAIAPLSTFKAAPSPLTLCDRLLTMAQVADRIGCRATAAELLRLAHTVLDERRPYDHD